MAKLIGICREDKWHFQNRQLPLEIDENLTMVMQFNDIRAGFEQRPVKNKELTQFDMKFTLLSKEEISEALTVKGKELFHTLSQTVFCVGCRRSVERLFNQLSEYGYPALQPLQITEDKVLTVRENYKVNSRSLCELFHSSGSKLSSLIDAIPKNKKNRRCLLHSLESQRSKPIGNWLEVWDLMSKECREEVVLVESDVLLDTLESYLRKHRFCGECKSKVMRAYNILIGKLDHSKEKGYVAHLYKGIRCCPPEKHVHVQAEANFINSLITRAEPEFRGNLSFSTRERHAKTVENAQEEVLICLGICLFERLHRIWQRLHEEDQTWQILFHLGMSELWKNFQLAVEDKQGYTQLEKVCEELKREELLKQKRLELKRLKRKKKKNKTPEDKENLECYMCEIVENDDENCENLDEKETKKLCNCGDYSSCSYNHSTISEDNFSSCQMCSGHTNSSWISDVKTENCYSESGYCSGNGNESSSSSSCENSEISCNESFCDQEIPSQSQTPITDSTSQCRCSINLVCRCSHPNWLRNGTAIKCCIFESGCGTSLQDMLEGTPCDCESLEENMSSEDIKGMRARLCQMDKQRQDLRKRLRKDFDKLKTNVKYRRVQLGPNNKQRN